MTYKLTQSCKSKNIARNAGKYLMYEYLCDVDKALGMKVV